LKLLFLADLNSAHIVKWVQALADRGYSLGIFTLNKADTPWYKDHVNIRVFDHQALPRKAFGGNAMSKLVYLKAVTELRRVILDFKPDIIHAHYATSYGLLGARSGFHPLGISAWGSDVMDFPDRSIMHRFLLKNNFKKADLILATGQTISESIHRITNQKVEIVSFGVDTAVFSPGPKSHGYTEEDLVIGTVKSLEEVYGIDILLKAFAMLKQWHPALPLKLLIVGGGSKENEYRSLAGQLGIAEQTHFAGKVSFQEVPAYHNCLDIFANLSHNESFGVSVLEAAACGKPVVLSDIGGLKEVVLPQITGIPVLPGDTEAAAKAFEVLVLDKELRQKMGREGRIFVEKNYSWPASLARMEQLYAELIS
jgi:glycosyltransferase involved in cell wall biosynthesis